MLREDRGRPDGFIQLEAHEPAGPDGVIELLHEQPHGPQGMVRGNPGFRRHEGHEEHEVLVFDNHSS